MEDSEAVDQLEVTEKTMDISTGEESAPNLPLEGADPASSPVATPVPDTSVISQATPEIHDNMITIVNSSLKENTPEASKNENEIECPSPIENCVNSTSESVVETLEVPPSTNPSQDCEIDEKQASPEGNGKASELEPAQVEETVKSTDTKNGEDVPEKISADGNVVETATSVNEDCVPLDGSLIIDEEEEHNYASSDDLEPQLNERTGAFEKPMRLACGRIVMPDTCVGSPPETVETGSEIAVEALNEKQIGLDVATSATANTENALSEEQEEPKKKSRSSIEESIERCIANYTSSSPPGSPPSRAKWKESPKFPHNFGFKIITNKIDLTTPLKRGLVIPSKLKQVEQITETPPTKKIKIKKNAKKPAVQRVESVSAASSPEKIVTEKKTNVENANQDQQAVINQPKNVKICFNKAADQPLKEKNPPKERPISCLKVRDVESINATIPIKLPVCEALPEDSSDPQKITPGAEGTDIVMSEIDAETAHVPSDKVNSSGIVLRPIAPKCDPIAHHDPHSVKVIKDLIQLPSIPVYIPDETVSKSKHFNGRLHVCHGCGDRFVLLKSLLEHQNRRSCVIKFQCLKCASAVLCFFNRCEFIRHLFNHNQTLTSTMLQYHIIVERLPTNAASVVFDVKTCHECKLFLKVPLVEHMQGVDQNDKKPDLALKCQWCSLMLPTKCAYQAHRRMHFLQVPHVCPECGESCSDLLTFNAHINSICYHTSKRSLFHCSSCKIEMFDARKLERHIRNKHIRDVFKCNFCFVACFTPDDLDRHRQHYHGDMVEEEEESFDETSLKYAFHLCDMCPNRLIRRVRLGQHVWDHTYSVNDVRYVFECRKCKVTFGSKETFAGHAATCTATVPASSPLLPAAVPNGAPEIVVPANPLSNSIDVPGDYEMTVSTEGDGDIIENASTEELLHSPENELRSDEMEAPPPLTRAPVHQAVKKATPPKNTDQIKQKPMKLISVKPDYVMFDQPKEASDFEDALSPEMDPLSAELEGSMEVALQCLDCGTNLTSELGSFCTSCEQKREAGAEGFPASTMTSLLTVEKLGVVAAKPLLPEGITLNAGSKYLLSSNKTKTTTTQKNDANKKVGASKFTCRICNVVITQTCDKAAMKRHFIAKHKEMFIAALQTGMESGKLVQKANILATLTQSHSEGSSGAKVTPVQKEKEPAVKTSFLKRPTTLRSPSKVSPKKRKKQKKISQLPKWNDSDTEDDSLLSRLSSKEMRRPKDRRKKSYSPPPVLDAATSGEVVTEQVGDMRSCYKCSFQSTNKTEFMEHVLIHKTNPKDVQCPACGTCFVVRPSLEKHLLIFHGMKNIDEYLADHGFSPAERETPDLESEATDVNQCRVCHLKFDTEALLEKHFRTHGSAFLLSNKFRRSMSS